MNIKFFLITVLSFFFFAVSCEKIEGEGGTSTISGKVLVQNYNNDNELIEEYYAPDEDVFIIYGENSSTYDDKFATSYDGSYKFEYLQPGFYKVFAYSQCDTCPGEFEVVSKEVEITETYKEYTLEDLIIKK